MAKRAAEDAGDEAAAMKGGDRPVRSEKGDELGDFEDEYEDEYESEEEMFEAGVDGRPDTERELEERRGMWITPVASCGFRQSGCMRCN